MGINIGMTTQSLLRTSPKFWCKNFHRRMLLCGQKSPGGLPDHRACYQHISNHSLSPNAGLLNSRTKQNGPVDMI